MSDSPDSQAPAPAEASPAAESMPGESYADLRRRADAALYAAKRGGRDLVAVSELPFDQMPVHPLATTTISRSA